jgi:hypothetical protein
MCEREALVPCRSQPGPFTPGLRTPPRLHEKHDESHSKTGKSLGLHEEEGESRECTGLEGVNPTLVPNGPEHTQGERRRQEAAIGYYG